MNGITRTFALMGVALLAAGSCSSDGPEGILTPDLVCSIPSSQIFDGGPGKDGIPALTDPELVPAGHASLSYLLNTDRVIGLIVNGEPIAMPLNVGWWHEIVNINAGGARIAVTHCPLTGSSLAFDRAPAGGATFGVSGLLYQNNLIMYDRNRPESLWPQMSRGARCGPRDGTALPMVAIIEMTWADWRSLYPTTQVVRGVSGGFYDYRNYPYGDYDQPNNERLLFPIQNLDRRRPLKERVLGVPDVDGGGVAFPFGALAARGEAAAVRYEPASGAPFVVLWDGFRRAAMAYRPVIDGQALTFEVRTGAIVDVQTQSTWDVDGRARSGPLSGKQLEPVREAYIAFWFGWAAFNRDTRLWTGGTT